MYENGIGVDKNESEAFEWVQEAAVQEHAQAQNNLAEYYMRGLGTPKDLNEAFDWYRQAAGQGHAQAQYNVGVCYMQGYGTPKHLKKAFEWFQKAADQGFAMAQCNLGICYAHGLGIPKNETEAFKWFQKGADQGHALAQNNLGHVYKYGMGVDKNEAEALMWYKKAAENGNQDQRTVLKTIFTYLPSQQNGSPLTLDDFNDVFTPLDDMLEFFKVWICIVDPASGFQEKGLKDKELYDLHTKLKESTQNLLTLVKTIQKPREHFLMTCLKIKDQAPKEWKDAVFAENYKGISYLSIGTKNIKLSKQIFDILQSDNPFQDIKEYIQSINDYNTREFKPLLKDRIAELTNQITLEGNQLKKEALEALQKKLKRLQLSEEDLPLLQENLDSFLSLLDQLKGFIEQYVVAGPYDRNAVFLTKNQWIKE